MLLDDIVLDSLDFFFIDAPTTECGILSASRTIDAGTSRRSVLRSHHCSQ